MRKIVTILHFGSRTELLQTLVDEGFEDAWPASLVLLRLDVEALLVEGPRALGRSLEAHADLVAGGALGLALAAVLLVRQLRSIRAARERDERRMREREAREARRRRRRRRPGRLAREALPARLAPPSRRALPAGRA